MKITILTDNPYSWVIPYVEQLKELLVSHELKHVFSCNEIKKGDIMLILSCEKILKKKYLELHKSNIVVHPSKLPHGKGWSPLAWQILEGSNSIPMTLFEAHESVDAGDIYIVDYIELVGNELNDEIKEKQGQLMIKMIMSYIEKFPNVSGVSQQGFETFYPRRTSKDSELDINKSLLQQFNLLRVVDNEKYPAFFIIDDKKYIIKIYPDNVNK